MQATLPALSADLGGPLAVRIGLHSGPVGAGGMCYAPLRDRHAEIQLRSLERYGEYREPHGIARGAGRIQVSTATYAVLESAYRFEDRGLIPIQGKGPLPTYWLLGRHPAGDPPAPGLRGPGPACATPLIPLARSGGGTR
jgi:hypothetical protein